jgi:hypothetical protein
MPSRLQALTAGFRRAFHGSVNIWIICSKMQAKLSPNFRICAKVAAGPVCGPIAVAWVRPPRRNLPLPPLRC